MRYFLLALEGHTMIALKESKSVQEVLDFAKETKVTGIIAEEYIHVDYSGEKPQPEAHINEAFRNLITQQKEGSGNDKN